MTLEPISIATAGYVCGEGPDPIAIAHLGYVCEAEAQVIGGDPDGAWARARAYYERRRRARRAERPPEPVRVEEELDDIDEIVAELEAELAALERTDAALLRLELEELQAAYREREIFAAMQAEEIRRDNVIYLQAVRAQMRMERLQMMLEYARQRRARLSDELAVVTATVAILFQ